jgi:GNAT superfamily N-acetyltransferase
MNSYGDWDLRPQLRTLNAPTLIVHGEDESIPMDLVEEWAHGGDFEPESLRRRLLYVAEEDGRPVGWAALIPRGEVGWLEDLWVEPAWIGRGLGRALFEHVAAEAKQRGARRLEWEAEPNAQGFYEHMGGAYVRDSEETEWGRVLQVLAVEL